MLVQKVAASAMMRTACLMGAAVRSKGANGTHRSFQSDVEEIVTSGRTQASDGYAGFGMNGREAAIAPFHHNGTGVKLKGFDKLNDVVIRHCHRAIVPDRRVVVLRLFDIAEDRFKRIEALYPLLAFIHVFLDNASYHHAKLVREWMAQPGR
jgi:hypothetical protein